MQYKVEFCKLLMELKYNIVTNYYKYPMKLGKHALQFFLNAYIQY